MYPVRDLEVGIGRESGQGSLASSELKQFLNVVPTLFKTVPYASAKLFYNIVTNGFCSNTMFTKVNRRDKQSK